MAGCPSAVPMHVMYDGLKSNHMLLKRYDGVTLDGRFWQTRTCSNIDVSAGCHPYAFGHMINHPPKGARPNVVSWPYEFVVDELTAELAGGVPLVHSPVWFIDVETFETCSPPSHLMPGIVMLCTQDLEDGDELLFDYRMSPPCPAWYTPVEY